MTTTLLVTYSAEVEQTDLRWLPLQWSTWCLEELWAETEGPPFFCARSRDINSLTASNCVACRQRSKASRMLTSSCSHTTDVHILNFDWNFHGEWLPFQDYISKFVSHSLRSQGWKTKSWRESEPKKEGQEGQENSRKYPVWSEDWSSRTFWYFGGRCWWTRGNQWRWLWVWVERQFPYMSGV